jgi:signal peptidase I
MQPTQLLADPALFVPRARVELPGFRQRSARPLPRVRWGRLALIAILASVVGGLALLRVWPPLATVMSGSMEPAINTGDMVVLQRLDRAPHVGDVVAINVPDEARSRYGYPPVVIHRIKRIAPDGRVTSQGDARPAPDPFNVPVSSLRTHVVGRIPGGGGVFAFLSSGIGLVWLAAGAVLLLGLPLLERQRDVRGAGAADGAGLRAQLEAITEELTELRFERLQERSALDRRYEELASASQAQLEAVAAALLERLPAHVERAVAEAVGAARVPPCAATPFWTMAAPAESATPPGVAELAEMAEVAAPVETAEVAGPAETPAPAEIAAPDCGAELAQLELALVAGPRAAPRADESEDQLALWLDVERARRFVRPCDDQLAFDLDPAPAPAPQLAFDFTPPRRRPAWDTPPIMVRRRSGGLVGSLDRRARRVLAGTLLAGVLS